jgi:tetratricopeptide (TPR) repeat protein
MGFFDKMFGNKAADDTATAETRGVDFIDALSMHLRGQTDQALSAYQKIVEQGPDDNLATFFAAAVKAGKGDTAEAAENLRSLSQRIASGGDTISRALSLDLDSLTSGAPFLRVPAIAEVIVSLGDALKKDGFVQESAVCFEIAVGLVPDHAQVLHKFGDTLHDLGMYDYAEKVLQEALRQAPNHWGALYTYAVLLQDLGRMEEAITYYEKAIRLNPDHANSQNNYGAALMMSNRLEEALEHCTLAAGLAPGSPLARINLGNIHLMMDQDETARTCFEEAIALDGTLAEAHFGIGSAEQLLGSDSGKVRESYLKAIELNPSFPKFHHALGNLLAREGNLDALAHFSAAEQLNNSLVNLQRDFGAACLKLGQRDEALKHLRAALQQYPDDETAREMLSKAEEGNQA